MNGKRPSRSGSVGRKPGTRVAALLAALLLVSLAACTGGDAGEGGQETQGGSGAAALIVGSALKTKQEGSARVTLTMATAVPGAQSFALTGRGAVDFHDGRGRLVFHVPDVFGEDQASTSRQTVEAIYDGSVVYLGADFLRQIVPGSRPWLAIDTRRASGSLGPLSQLSQFGQSDPVAALRLVEGLTGSLETVGHDVDVGGVTTTHYRFTIDIADALDKASGVTRAQLQALKKQGLDTIPADVWLDEAGVARKVRYELELPPGATGGGGRAKVTVTMELTDFGLPVHVTPPPSGQVTDIGQLVGQ